MQVCAMRLEKMIEAVHDSLSLLTGHLDLRISFFQVLLSHNKGISRSETHLFQVILSSVEGI